MLAGPHRIVPICFLNQLRSKMSAFRAIRVVPRTIGSKSTLVAGCWCWTLSVGVDGGVGGVGGASAKVARKQNAIGALGPLNLVVCCGSLRATTWL